MTLGQMRAVIVLDDCDPFTAFLRKLTPEYKFRSCDPEFELGYRLRYLRSRNLVGEGEMAERLGWTVEKLRDFESQLNMNYMFTEWCSYLIYLGYNVTFNFMPLPN